MAQEGYITEAMAKLALAHPAQAIREKGNGAVNYAADYVMDQLDDTIGAIDRDIVVSTTLSAPLEKDAEKALTDVLEAKAAHYGVSQGAIVAMAPDGAVRAMIGGRNYAESQFNRAIAAKRQPGSAFKPFVYLTALERGLTPDSLRLDAPINVRGWRPENYEHRYLGQVSLTHRARLVAQYGRGAARPRSRACRDHQNRASPRHHRAASIECLDRARHVRGDAAGTGDGLCAFRQWRDRGRALCDHHDPHRRRQDSSISVGRRTMGGSSIRNMCR